MRPPKVSFGPLVRSLACLLVGGLAALPLARAQRTAGEASEPRSPRDESDREARQAEAKIQLRVFESRIGVKQAELKVEQARLDFSRRLEKLAHVNERAQSGIPLQGEIEVLKEEARVIAKKAELDEATARYREAKRRFDAGWLPPIAPSGAPDEVDRRLNELERQVERLTSSVEKLGRKF